MKKLRLRRETLRRLDKLDGVAGGFTYPTLIGCPPHSVQCNPPTQTCPTIICSQ